MQTFSDEQKIRYNRIMQQQRDEIANRARMNTNRDKYDPIVKLLKEILKKDYKLTNIKKIALKTSMEKKIGIDRLAKRSFSILICWLCETWDVIGDDFLSNCYDFLKEAGRKRINHITHFQFDEQQNSTSTPNESSKDEEDEELQIFDEFNDVSEDITFQNDDTNDC